MRPANSQEVMRKLMSAMTLIFKLTRGHEGGELLISTDFGEQKVKLKAGRCSGLQPSVPCTKVTPVTKGTRLAASHVDAKLIPQSNSLVNPCSELRTKLFKILQQNDDIDRK